MNTNWNSLTKRIQSESYQKNGKTIDAVSSVSVRIVLQDGNPILWEILGSNKIEPSCTLTETVAKFSNRIQQLMELCDSQEQVDRLLARLIENLQKKNG